MVVFFGVVLIDQRAAGGGNAPVLEIRENKGSHSGWLFLGCVLNDSRGCWKEGQRFLEIRENSGSQ